MNVSSYKVSRCFCSQRHVGEQRSAVCGISDETLPLFASNFRDDAVCCMTSAES